MATIGAVLIVLALLSMTRSEPSPDIQYSSDPFLFITKRDGVIDRDEYQKSSGLVAALDEAERTALCWAKNAYQDYRLTLNSVVRIVDSSERARAADLLDSRFKNSMPALAVEDYRTKFPEATQPDIQRALLDAGYTGSDVREGLDFLEALTSATDTSSGTSYVVFEVASTTRSLRVVRLQIGTAVNRDHRAARRPSFRGH